MTDSWCLPLLQYQNNSDHMRFFSLCLKTSSPLVLMEDSVWKSMQQSPILQLILAFFLAYKGEWDLQGSWVCGNPLMDPGFKLFCLGYGEMEFIWQPQETGPHLIACNKIHPPETPPCAGSICWYPFKLFIDFHGTVTSVSKLTLVTLLKGTGSLEWL